MESKRTKLKYYKLFPLNEGFKLVLNSLGNLQLFVQSPEAYIKKTIKKQLELSNMFFIFRLT